MTEHTAIVKRYLDVWNETDPAARRRAVETVWTPDARYVDPLADVRGHADIDALIGAAQGQFQGLTFTLAGQVEGHHDTIRFCWRLGAHGGESIVEGSDVAVVGDGGRLTSVYGFLDKVPAA